MTIAITNGAEVQNWYGTILHHHDGYGGARTTHAAARQKSSMFYRQYIDRMNLVWFDLIRFDSN